MLRAIRSLYMKLRSLLNGYWSIVWARVADDDAVFGLQLYVALLVALLHSMTFRSCSSFIFGFEFLSISAVQIRSFLGVFFCLGVGCRCCKKIPTICLKKMLTINILISFSETFFISKVDLFPFSINLALLWMGPKLIRPFFRQNAQKKYFFVKLN